MEKTVDARGLNCPEPVIMTKKVMQEEKPESMKILLSNRAAMENVSKLARSQNYEVVIGSALEDEFCLCLRKQLSKNESVSTAKVAILISNQYFGNGSEELGDILMKSFLYSLSEIELKISHLIFMNSGVYLSTEGSAYLEHLSALEEKGVEILSCGTCLDFYQLKDKLCVGSVTNMYTAVEILSNAPRQITI